MATREATTITISIAAPVFVRGAPICVGESDFLRVTRVDGHTLTVRSYHASPFVEKAHCILERYMLWPLQDAIAKLRTRH